MSATSPCPLKSAGEGGWHRKARHCSARRDCAQRDSARNSSGRRRRQQQQQRSRQRPRTRRRATAFCSSSRPPASSRTLLWDQAAATAGAVVGRLRHIEDILALGGAATRGFFSTLWCRCRREETKRSRRSAALRGQVRRGRWQDGGRVADTHRPVLRRSCPGGSKRPPEEAGHGSQPLAGGGAAGRPPSRRWREARAGSWRTPRQSGRRRGRRCRSPAAGGWSAAAVGRDAWARRPAPTGGVKGQRAPGSVSA